MITATVFLVMSIFGGSPNFFSIPKTETKIFTIQKIEKHLRNSISDKNREKEARHIFQQAKREIKSLEKQLKESGKEFKELQSDRTVKSNKLTEVFMKSEEVRKKVQLVLVEKRMMLRQLIRENEWNEFIREGIKSIAENPKKRDKEIRKIEEVDNKTLSRVQKKLTKQINDESRQKKAFNAYIDFEEKVNSLTEESITYLQENDKAAQQYQTDQKVLENVFITLNKSREEAMVSFLILREELIGLSSEEEWKKIAKTLNSML